MDNASAALVNGWQDPEVWNTSRVAPHRQFDCWREFVVDAHMHWAIPRLRCERFPAYIRQGRFEGFRVTHLTSGQGGVPGTRGRHEIARDHEALYNLIYIAEGSIGLTIDGRELLLDPGSFALWDTTRPMRFVTGHGLRQITFAVPQPQLQRVLPRAGEYVGHGLRSQGQVSRLFVEHLLALDRGFGELPPEAAGHVLNATLELLAATLSAEHRLPACAGSGVLLQRVLAYVGRRLDDPDLDTPSIASAHGVSERHVHRLFASLKTTPAAWIREQRLERCRQDLRDAVPLSITQIAYRWGFRDSGTFSKVFRRRYGVSPRALRGHPDT